MKNKKKYYGMSIYGRIFLLLWFILAGVGLNKCLSQDSIQPVVFSGKLVGEIDLTEWYWTQPGQFESDEEILLSKIDSIFESKLIDSNDLINRIDSLVRVNLDAKFGNTVPPDPIPDPTPDPIPDPEPQPGPITTIAKRADQEGLAVYHWADHNQLPINTIVVDQEDNTEVTQISDGRVQFILKNDGLTKRDEIRQSPWNVRNPLGTEHWIGFDYTFGQPDPANQSLLFQAHSGIVGKSPNVELELSKDGQFSSQPGAQLYVVRKGDANDYDRTGIFPQEGQTIEFVIHLVWGNSFNGLLQVWADGVKIYDEQVATTYPDARWGGNLKWGIYKWPWASASNRAKSAAIGVNEIKTSMGDLRILTRFPDHPDYLKNDYETVKPR